MDNLKRCTKCLLPETHESISFDSEGVCSVCRQVEFKGENDTEINLPSHERKYSVHIQLEKKEVISSNLFNISS